MLSAAAAVAMGGKNKQRTKGNVRVRAVCVSAVADGACEPRVPRDPRWWLWRGGQRPGWSGRRGLGPLLGLGRGLPAQPAGLGNPFLAAASVRGLRTAGGRVFWGMALLLGPILGLSRAVVTAGLQGRLSVDPVFGACVAASCGVSAGLPGRDREL